MGIWRLDAFPSLWWDEGWTVTVARTWVEQGHYGLTYDGRPAPSTLSGHFPVVAMVAGSFKLFGVGVWQARLPGVILAVGSLALLYILSKRMFGRRVALVTLGIALLFPVKWGLHPLIMGRQVLGEVPSLFFILAGYLFLDRALRGHAAWLVLAVTAWGMALMTKSQVAPFLAASLAVAAFTLLYMRQRRLGLLLLLSLALSFGVYYGLEFLKGWILEGRTIAGAPVRGLRESVAVVLNPTVRFFTFLRFGLLFGLPTIVALLYATIRLHRQMGDHIPPPEYLKVSLVVLAATWLGWFILLSVGWERYAFPPIFLALPFLAAMISDVTDGFRLKRFFLMLRERSGLIPVKPLAREYVVALVMFLMVGLTLASLYRLSQQKDDTSAREVASFLNSTTPPNTVVESYESEVFFFLDRPYTYPEPQVIVDLVLKTHHDSDLRVERTVEKVEADYLVIGEWGDWSGLYEPLIESGRYTLVKVLGGYRVYKKA